MMRRSGFLLLLAATLLSPSQPASSEVVLQWVDVGDPGNACHPRTQACFGAVAELYRISKFEVSNGPYAEFLNAVAATDTNALYNTNMGSGQGGISRSGSSGSFSYSVVSGRRDWPVNFVSFWDATRFANWLHNGQPTGVQSNATTEDGAYTLTPTGIADNTVTRNAEAEFFVPSEDEWYKAAYYDPDIADYFTFPTGSNTVMTCSFPGPTANTGNCDSILGAPARVGTYTGSASPAGTFDQGGNADEWNDTISNDVRRGQGGGSFLDLPILALAGIWLNGTPTDEELDLGFRVASVPMHVPIPPVPVPSLSPLGMAASFGLLGLAAYLRLRSQPST